MHASCYDAKKKRSGQCVCVCVCARTAGKSSCLAFVISDSTHMPEHSDLTLDHL